MKHNIKVDEKDRYSESFPEKHIFSSKTNGVYKWYHLNRNLKLHGCVKKGKYHGECKWYSTGGQPKESIFYQASKDITKEVKALVSDINNITDEEKLLIKLQFDVDCLPPKGTQ